MNNEILGRTLCLFILLCIRFGEHYFFFLSVFSLFYSLFLFFNFHVPFNININVLWMGVCCDNANSKEKLKTAFTCFFLSRVFENHGWCEWERKKEHDKREKNSDCKLSAWLFLYVTESFFFILSIFFSYRTNGVGLVWNMHEILHFFSARVFVCVFSSKQYLLNISSFFL